MEKRFTFESYENQKKRWPVGVPGAGGKVILAHYDEDSIVVYQAYNPTIAR